MGALCGQSTHGRSLRDQSVTSAAPLPIRFQADLQASARKNRGPARASCRRLASEPGAVAIGDSIRNARSARVMGAAECGRARVMDGKRLGKTAVHSGGGRIM